MIEPRGLQKRRRHYASRRGASQISPSRVSSDFSVTEVTSTPAHTRSHARRCVSPHLPPRSAFVLARSLVSCHFLLLDPLLRKLISVSLSLSLSLSLCLSISLRLSEILLSDFSVLRKPPVVVLGASFSNGAFALARSIRCGFMRIDCSPGVIVDFCGIM